MKLPLTVDCRVSHLKIVDADGEVVKQNHENLQALVALANAHAAQPGAPREDGSWVVRTVGVQEHLASKRVKIKGRWYWESSNGIYIPEESIVAHRKHTPLEVPHG